VGNVPFVYLGLPIGGDQCWFLFWDPVLSRLEKTLFAWKSRYLSFSGRSILLKYVMTSLHVYVLSFFKTVSGIISSLKSMLNNFFWSGSEEHRKMT